MNLSQKCKKNRKKLKKILYYLVTIKNYWRKKMRIIDIEVKSGKYNIYLEKNFSPKLNEYIEKYEKVLIITDDIVENLHLKKFMENLSISADRLSYYAVTNGEKSKTSMVAEKIYDFLIENEFYRNSLIITLGGGVVCDLGGYVASTYMRGVDFIQVPTTLLAQVDASIGGKVAINHKKTKNIIGCFYQPKAVFISIDFLKTLEKKHFKSGVAEMVKHSLICENEEYFNFLSRYCEEIECLNERYIEEAIEESCKIKKSVVEKDEKETGDRVFLNLGHTYAHALESIYALEGVSHGEAVAKGIIFELQLFKYLEEDLSIAKEIENKINNIKMIFEKFQIDCKPVYVENKALIGYLKKDKKNSNNGVTFIKFNDFGKLEVRKITEDKIEEFNLKIKDENNRFIKAVIDVGSNSTRIFISEVETIQDSSGNNRIKIINSLYKWVEITSLGKGVTKDKVLNREAMDRTFNCIKWYKEKALKYGASKIEAYATSAVRDAKNREEFMKEIQEIGVDIQCIEGEIEAKLSFIGISSIYPKREIGIIDIGGGSTEISIGMDDRIDYSASYNVGAVRVTEMFFQSINSNGEIVEDYSDETIKKAKDWLKEEFSYLKKFEELDFTLLGVAGTVSKQVTILEKMDVYDVKVVDRYVLSLDNIKENYRMLIGKSLEERKHLPGLEPKRAEYVIAGTLILIVLLEDILKKDKIIFSEIDNLEGSIIYFS